MTELVAESACELAGNLVRGLDGGRLLALGLAADLHNVHGLALERDLGLVINNGRALANDLADAQDLARIVHGDRDLIHAIRDACARAYVLATGLADARDRDRATRAVVVDPGLTADRALAGARAYADARDLARRTASDLARDLTVARDRANGLAGDRAVARDRADAVSTEIKERDDQARPARPAVRVAWTAAGLLPRPDRMRYDLEYRSELEDMAAAGAGRRQQLWHAARLLSRSPLLRVELAGARRRQAAQ